MHSRDRSFGSDSPIRDYWLTRCEGFTVRSGARRLGVVQDVDCGRSSPLAETLVVRRRRRGTVLLPAASVYEVIPSQELLRARRPRSAAQRAAGTAGRGTRSTAGAAARGARTTAAATRRAASTATPVVVAFAALAGAVVRHLALSAGRWLRQDGRQLARRLGRDAVLLARWAARALATWGRTTRKRLDRRRRHYAVARFLSRRPS
jgi:hypothetical protein